MAEKTVPSRVESKDLELVNRGTRDDERYLIPPADIYEHENALVVVADLPGVSKENVQLSVEKGVLTIEGAPGHVLTKEPIRREFRLLKFYRQFELSETIDVEKITADMKHGVLTITLPKVEHAKPRVIKVHAV